MDHAQDILGDREAEQQLIAAERDALCNDAREITDRLLDHLSDQFHITTTSHVAEMPHETSFNEGERNVVLYLLAMRNESSAIVTERTEQQDEQHDPHA